MTSRLAEFEIRGLFGLYSHRIRINLAERITIIIGPNGRGKTVCLKFIEAFFKKKFAYFRTIPFSMAQFTFSGGEAVTIVPSADGERTADGGSFQKMIFTIEVPGNDTKSWTPGTMDNNLNREIRRFIGSDWRQADYNLWIDDRDGEEIDLDELTTRFNLPSKLISALRHNVPAEFDVLVGPIDCYLIETQRLLVLPKNENNEFETFVHAGRRMRRPAAGGLAIQEKAAKLKSIFKDKLSESANLSQSLDRTFPLRVFDAQGSVKFSNEQLRQELRKLDERREAFMAAGILDTDYQPVTMRSGEIEPGVAKALEIYVSDTTQKLNTFNDLYARVDLLKELMASRFIDKTIQIDRENGFKIRSKTGMNVPLEKLSSGEQHQLILVFDLIFEVSKNSLILIDEPELSLHVAWQRTFIEGLEKIILLNEFDVILATHSPALIAKHFDLTVELGPVDG